MGAEAAATTREMTRDQREEGFPECGQGRSRCKKTQRSCSTEEDTKQIYVLWLSFSFLFFIFPKKTSSPTWSGEDRVMALETEGKHVWNSLIRKQGRKQAKTDIKSKVEMVGNSNNESNTYIM